MITKATVPRDRPSPGPPFWKPKARNETVAATAMVALARHHAAPFGADRSV